MRPTSRSHSCRGRRGLHLPRRFATGALSLACLVLVGLFAAPSALAQEPAGYYDTVDTSDPSAMRSTLHDVIDDHQRFPYTDSTTDTWDIVNLADEDPNDTGNIVDVYKNASYAKIPGGIGAYNREHSWPKSYGFPNDGEDNSAYTDTHHLFAADGSYNSARSNKPFRWCDASCEEWTTDFTDGRGGGSGVYPGNSNWTSGSFTQGTWETWDGRKGDVARALFYMAIRYEGGTHGVTGFSEPDLRLTDDEMLIDQSRTGSNESVAYMGMLSVLLDWHVQDPVDAREIWRNEVVYSFQGNRNPFIDHPEWADCIFLGVCDGTGDVTPPGAPTTLMATAGDGSVALNWDDNTEPDLNGYYVYRATASGGPYTKINGPIVSSSAFTDSQATNGTTYFYVVAAVDTSGNVSADSNEASATPQGDGGGDPPPPGGGSDLVISEVLYDVSSTDDGLEWVELFNAGSTAIDLSGWSLGNGGTDYTYSVVQLSGTVQPGATFVVGGPNVNGDNASPTYDQTFNFSPDFQNSGSAGDGVALFDVTASSLTAATVPVDAVVYGPNNANGLIDETGTANAPEIGDASANTSLERVDLAGTWQYQSNPTPNATTLQPVQNAAPTVTITAPADGTSVSEGTTVTFTGTADDTEDGDLSASLSWTSDLDGSLGTGASVDAVLSVGLHTVTAEATDSGSLTGSASISVEVTSITGGTGDLLLSEVLYDVSGTDDGFEWVEIYNAGSETVDLSGWSLGAGGVDYTYSTVQLSGSLAPGELFVVGGPSSSPVNASPSLDQAANFDPDIQNSGSAGDGVALFNVPASSIIAATVPVDAVIYGPDNANGLIDESGTAPSGPDVGDAPSDSSIERLDLAGAWQIQSAPTPNASPLVAAPPSNTAPSVLISLPSDGQTFTEGESVSFAASASDAEDGDLSASITWSSDLDGAIGSGGSFTSAALSRGVHVITASVTDSGGLAASDAVSIEILAPTGPTTVVFTSLGGEDGWLLESSENSSSGGTSQPNGKSSEQIRVGDDRKDRRYKALVSFDTSSIPAGATIQSVTLRLRRGGVKGINPHGPFGDLRADVRHGAFGGDPALEDADYGAPATAFEVVSLPNPANDGDWTEGDFDAAGLAAVSRDGRTQLRLFFPLGDNDNRDEDYLAFYSGDDGDPTNHPQLVVTYEE